METLGQMVVVGIFLGSLLALPFWLLAEAGWVGLLGGVVTWGLFAYSVSGEWRGKRS